MEIYGFPSCLENLESLATVNTSSTGLVDDMHTEQFAPDHWPLSCTYLCSVSLCICDLYTLRSFDFIPQGMQSPEMFYIGDCTGI